jgi:hypothetical protein
MNIINDKDFYIPSSSLILTVNGKPVQFQVSTSSLTTSLCDTTIAFLNCDNIESIVIKLNNQFYTMPVISNSLKGNILGMDILSQLNVTFKKGQMYFNNFY